VSYLHWTAIRPHHIFDVVVFHRPRYTKLWFALFYWLKQRGCILLADVDDLVFDVQLAHYSPAVLNQVLTLSQIHTLFASHYQALAKFDVITTSTQALAEQTARCFPTTRVQLLHNAVHRTWRSLPKTNAIKKPIISYFPGTRSHDRDFAMYAEALQIFLADNPSVELHITGALAFNVSARPKQIVYQSKVPFAEYASRVQQAWVNLAPLENTPFTQCKSALKVIEAGFCSIPTVCTTLPDAQRFVNAGALFANDTASCVTQLNNLMNTAYYQDISNNLAEQVLVRANIDDVMNQFLRIIQYD
jgi:glycosyltransferase involved in cell wall biosynthesis